MATKSILKNIFIQDRKPAESLITASEESERNSEKEIILSKPVENLNRAQINSLFDT